MNKLITTSASKTKEIAQRLAHQIPGGTIICLQGDLGSGKTTFTQGLLQELGAKGPYTSPTFVVMKEYKLEAKDSKLKNIYHIDAYRIGPDDLKNLGWQELTSSSKNLIVIEWAQRVKEIIPQEALWIKFKWMDKNKREIVLPPTLAKNV